jgi:hypothetical protein
MERQQQALHEAVVTRDTQIRQLPGLWRSGSLATRTRAYWTIARRYAALSGISNGA